MQNGINCRGEYQTWFLQYLYRNSYHTCMYMNHVWEICMFWIIHWICCTVSQLIQNCIDGMKQSKNVLTILDCRYSGCQKSSSSVESLIAASTICSIASLSAADSSLFSGGNFGSPSPSESSDAAATLLSSTSASPWACSKRSVSQWKQLRCAVRRDINGSDSCLCMRLGDRCKGWCVCVCVCVVSQHKYVVVTTSV